MSTRPLVAALRPDVVVADILTLAPALAAELEGMRVATVIPHLDPRTERGWPPFSLGARRPRTAALGLPSLADGQTVNDAARVGELLVVLRGEPFGERIEARQALEEKAFEAQGIEVVDQQVFGPHLIDPQHEQVREFAAMVRAAMQVTGEIEFEAARKRDQHVRALVSDPALAMSVLGWCPVDDREVFMDEIVKAYDNYAAQSKSAT